MFKSMLMSSTRLFAPEDGTGSDKAAIQAQRDSIKVTVSSPTGDGEVAAAGEGEGEKTEGEGDDKSGDDDASGDKGDGENSGEGDTGDEVKDAKDAIAENKDEIKDLEKKQAEATDEKTKQRFQKRIDKLTASNSELRQQLQDMQAKLAEKKEGEGLTEADVEERAEAKANQKHAEREFANACKRIADAAMELDKDFPKKIAAMAEEVGQMPSVVVGIIDDLDNKGEVMNHLAENPDEMEEIYRLSPPRMALKLSKLSTKLETEKKTKVAAETAKKKVSNLPDPIKPIGGSQSSPTVLTDKMPARQWIEERNRQVAEKNRQRHGR
jgi:chromosome segregation ATPase